MTDYICNLYCSKKNYKCNLLLGVIMENFLSLMIRQNIELALIICLILLLRIFFQKKLSPRSIYLLWFIVLIKSVTYLNVPFAFEQPTIVNTEVVPVSGETISSQVNANPVAPQVITLQDSSSAPSEIATLNLLGKSIENKPLVKATQTSSWYDIFDFGSLALLLVGLYIVILIALLTHLVVSLKKVGGLKKDAIHNEKLTETLNALKLKLNVKNKVEIFASNSVPSPVLIGLKSFTILIPSNIIYHISDTNLEDVVVHELMHIKRKDCIMNLALRIVTCFYFFNPFVWVAYFAMKQDMEYACDNDVLACDSFQNHFSYAESLLLITKLCKQKALSNQFAMSFIHKNTFKRIENITNLTKNSAVSRISFTLAVLLALIVFVPSYRLVSQEVITNKKLETKTFEVKDLRNEDAKQEAWSELKKSLGVNNIIEFGKDIEFYKIFNFKGSLKEFKEFVKKEAALYVIIFNNNLYFSSIPEEQFLQKMSRINSFKNMDQNLKKALEKKISEINMPVAGYLDFINNTLSQELGAEIDAITNSRYDLLKSLKHKAGFYRPQTFSNISVWEILVIISSKFGYSFNIDFADNKIIFSENREVYDKYQAQLKEVVEFDAIEYEFGKFIQMCREKKPELIIIQKMPLDEKGLKETDKIVLPQKRGELGVLIEKVLSQKKMQYHFSGNAVMIATAESIAKEKEEESLNKKIFLAAYHKGSNAKVDIENLLSKPVSFDFTSTKLKDGLEQLSLLSGINFVYEEGVITQETNVNIQMVANGMSVKNALRWILANVNCKYSVYKENSIIIRKPKLIEIPATFVKIEKDDFQNEIKNNENRSNFLVIKTNSNFRIDSNSIKEIKLKNEELDKVNSFEWVSSENNYILVKKIKGDILPGTACTVFYND